MSIEENKKLVRRYCEEVADQGKLDLIDEFFAPDPSYYGPDYLENFKLKRALRAGPSSLMLASI
jgi:hypothetical protein